MKSIKFLLIGVVAIFFAIMAIGCNQKVKETAMPIVPVVQTETPEYFLLRPEVEKMYGYSHAV